ncbi:MAG: SEC-C metal-binding domain-containing protein, partial [Chloroflexota bacterium]
MSTVGRNEPCPCGSGRKYKHCCLVREDASRGVRDRLFDFQDDLTMRMLVFALER